MAGERAVWSRIRVEQHRHVTGRETVRTRRNEHAESRAVNHRVQHLDIVFAKARRDIHRKASAAPASAVPGDAGTCSALRSQRSRPRIDAVRDLVSNLARAGEPFLSRTREG